MDRVVINNYGTITNGQINGNVSTGNLHYGMAFNNGSAQFGLTPAGHSPTRRSTTTLSVERTLTLVLRRLRRTRATV